jgi:hypothetical protein
MNRFRLPLFAFALVFAAPAHATECFSMFDAANTLVYQSTTTPINLSGSISIQMARYFPSRYLVISDVGTCVEAGTGSAGAVATAGSTADGGALFGADATSRAPVAVTRDDAPAVRRANRVTSGPRR